MKKIEGNNFTHIHTYIHTYIHTHLNIVLIHAVPVLHSARGPIQGRLDARKVLSEAETVNGVRYVELVEGEVNHAQDVVQG